MKKKLKNYKYNKDKSIDVKSGRLCTAAEM